MHPVFDPEEAIKNMFLIGFSQPNALIAHVDRHSTVIDITADFDLPTLWRILDSIAQQVVNHLSQPSRAPLN